MQDKQGGILTTHHCVLTTGNILCKLISDKVQNVRFCLSHPPPTLYLFSSFVSYRKGEDSYLLAKHTQTVHLI